MGRQHVSGFGVEAIADDGDHHLDGDHCMGDIAVDGVIDLVEIGRGGFSVVYRGVEEELNRHVAVKVIQGTLDDRGRERFDRERRAMGALSGHPNIVIVHRSGYLDDSSPYIVMEYLEGGSLDRRIETEGPLPWDQVVEVGISVAGALESAHELGVLHRDIKPGNLLHGPSGVTKLADFGIARIAGSPETTSRTITASLAHAAPEVIDGKRPSVASDIYSLASTLFELGAGRSPFHDPTDDSMVPMLARIARDPIPYPEGAPGSLDRILRSAMAKDPEARPASALDFGRELMSARDKAPTSHPIVVTTQIDATPPPPPGTETDTSDASQRPAQPVDNDPSVPAPPPPPAPLPPTPPAPAPGAAEPQPKHGDDSPPRRTIDRRAIVLGAVGIVVVAAVAVWFVRSIGGSSSALPSVRSADYPAYSTVFDVSGALRVEVPTAWREVDDGSSTPAVALAAAPDLVAARTGFEQPGVSIEVGPGRSAEELDALLPPTLAGCTESTDGDYSDPAYAGRYRRYGDCGLLNSTVWHLAVVPPDGRFTILVTVQAVTERDESAARRVLDTFLVDPVAL